MSGSIGATACDFAKGYVAEARQVTHKWSVPGISGQGRQRLGTQPVQSAIVLVKFGTEAAVRDWYGEIEEIQQDGDPVAYVNDQGESVTVFVETVGQLKLTAASGAGGTRGQVELQVTGAD